MILTGIFHRNTIKPNIKACFLFLLLSILFCVKFLKNNQPEDDKLIVSDTGYKKIDLSYSLSRMNDTAEIKKEIKKKEARPEKDIAEYVHKKLESLQYEYTKRMQKTGSFDGSVRFEFKIISSGEVISVETLRSSIRDPVFIDNLKKRIFMWNFGAIQDENDTTTVKYPFVFDY
jgi:hypothetical protein